MWNKSRMALEPPLHLGMLVGAVVVHLLTRSQTGLSYGQVIVVVGSWAVLGGFSMALHLHSFATAVSSSILLLFVCYGQWRAHRSPGA